jgi:hypothetical protein
MHRVLALAALLTACTNNGTAVRGPRSAPPPWGPGATLADVAVIGDIAQAGRTDRARATAALVSGHQPAVQAVLLSGDNARFGVGASGISLLEYYRTYWASPSEANWGQFDDIALPTPGNHEYGETDAQGYFTYFAARLRAITALPGYSGAADVVGKGWYSLDLNGWHIISLNSMCSAVGGCGPGSPQEQWLAQDLAAHPGVPIVAVWHEPRYACGGHNDVPEMQTLWADLVAAGADLVFGGHNHFYQRYKPLDAATPAAVDELRGLTEVIDGSGGVTPYAVCSTVDPRVAAQIGGEPSAGVVFLTLASDGGWELEYRLVSDGSVFDAASGMSHHPRR